MNPVFLILGILPAVASVQALVGPSVILARELLTQGVVLAIYEGQLKQFTAFLNAMRLVVMRSRDHAIMRSCDHATTAERGDHLGVRIDRGLVGIGGPSSRPQDDEIGRHSRGEDSRLPVEAQRPGTVASGHCE